VQKKESEKELEELRNGFKEGQVLGNDRFLEELRDEFEIKEEQEISIRTILSSVSHVLEVEESLILSSNKSRRASLARATIALLVNEESQTTLEEVAKMLNRDSSTISSLLARFHKKYSQSDELKNLVKKSKEKAREIAELQA